eukprot:TRINITY_DN2090_c0_g1_i1.p1 TRINITY_DN2090_c0_g1~~TRINITY_DN2090_c0_g1_i1.p1  ORF type:complete len:714 (+),score=227.13 TRINITY_DN2090_c0_g1_i1:88-2142(+)
MTDYTAAIQSLQRTFGNKLDKDTLAAVLEVCGGDAKAAAQFLQAGDNQTAYDPNQLHLAESGIAQDYPGKGWKNPSNSLVDIKSDIPAFKMKALFLNENVSLQEHFDTQTKEYDLYVAVLMLLIHQGVDISKASRPRILAAAWARHDNKLAQFLISKEELFGLPQILTALGLLDASRKVRCIEKKIARIEKQGTIKAKKLGQMKSSINDLKREAHIGSVSGSLAKHIRRWVKQIPAEKLEYYALNMPKGPWIELADVVHFNPNDFQCKWFLSYVFGAPAPEDSLINLTKTVNADNLVSVLGKCKIPYSWLRLNVKPLPEASKAIIAGYSPLDTIIWYHEELCNAQVNEIINKRLDEEEPTFGYGKLMERLLYFKSIDAPFFQKMIPVAEKRLKAIDLRLETPCVILGDASNSMDVAIRVATVISSVITAVSGAELKFFTGECVNPPLIPRTALQVLDVATKVKANGLTAPAAALWPYYQQKKIVKFFIVVTDEVENEKYNNTFFPNLFQKYHTEVFPAKIVFVSFLENPSEKGRMVNALESMGIIPLQFRLDGKRPDLTKLDSLLGLLASEASSFPQSADRWKDAIDKEKLEETYKSLQSIREEKEEIKEEKKEEKKEMDVVEKKQENKNEEDKFCVICEERPCDTALLDCGHLSFCSNCAQPLKECPICRQNVVRTIRIYQNA